MAEYVQIGAAPRTDQSCAAQDAPAGPVIQLQVITLVWMLIECGISLYGAVHARSSALLAFGSDSLVELLSATVVLLQFAPARFRLSRTRAARTGGFLLFVLAAVVAATAIASLALKIHADSCTSGILITLAALIAMPLLAWRKRTLARRRNDRALAADAVQSATCAYLAATTLAGLGINALFHLPWVDSAAALLAIPFLVVEARQGLRGESCGCC